MNDSDRTIEIHGHRGWRALFPENSIIGCHEASKLNIDAIEIDLVVDADHQLIVSHEAYFNPKLCTGPSGQELSYSPSNNIYTMTQKDIGQYHCGHLYDPNFPNQTLQKHTKPSLKKLIHEVALASHQYWNIELKFENERKSLYYPDAERYATIVIEEISALGIAHSCLLQSFSYELLQAIYKQNDSLRLGLLIDRPTKVKDNISELGFVPDFYNPHYALLSSALVNKAHSLNMKVVPWTVNDVNEMKNLIAMGVDGLITDYPKKALHSVVK